MGLLTYLLWSKSRLKDCEFAFGRVVLALAKELTV